MRQFIVFIIFCFYLPLSSRAQEAFNIGEIVHIESSILSEKRTLNVYLPTTYDAEAEVEHSVIYVLDGSTNEDFLHIVGLVQFFELQFKLPPTIVVGIANVDRKRDFTFPTSDEELKAEFPTTGGSANFIEFIEKELQVFIDKRYKTNARRILIGQSLGGLLAAEIVLKQADLFSDYIIVSPSMWWDNASLLNAASTLAQAQKTMPLQAYISVGSEGKVMKRGAKGLRSALKKSSNSQLQLHFVPLPKENHATILHHSVYRAFRLFFPYQEEER